jgi:hypothetical protein
VGKNPPFPENPELMQFYKEGKGVQGNKKKESGQGMILLPL